MSRGNRGHFRTSFLPISLREASHLLGNDLLAPLRLCLRRRLRMVIYSQPVFFALFRHTLHTPPSQGRAGAS